MRSIAKLAIVATLIILCTCTQLTEAQPQTIVRPRTKGVLVLKTNSIVFAEKKLPIQLMTLDNPCCPDRPSCCFEELKSSRESVDNIEGIKNIVDLGILVDLPSKFRIVMEEASIEIYSKGDKLVFSTEAKCGGCGKMLNLKTAGNSTSYLLALDKAAASAAQPYFVKGNKLVVIFKVKGIGMPDTVYLVNKN